MTDASAPGERAAGAGLSRAACFTIAGCAAQRPRGTGARLANTRTTRPAAAAGLVECAAIAVEDCGAVKTAITACSVGAAGIIIAAAATERAGCASAALAKGSAGTVTGAGCAGIKSAAVTMEDGYTVKAAVAARGVGAAGIGEAATQAAIVTKSALAKACAGIVTSPGCTRVKSFAGVVSDGYTINGAAVSAGFNTVGIVISATTIQRAIKAVSVLASTGSTTGNRRRAVKNTVIAMENCRAVKAAVGTGVPGARSLAVACAAIQRAVSACSCLGNSGAGALTRPCGLVKGVAVTIGDGDTVKLTSAGCKRQATDGPGLRRAPNTNRCLGYKI